MFVENNWPLLSPPLLTLIDDPSIPIKAKGCIALDSFLQHVPTSLLDRTGLREVYERALVPCLSYLPTLTEEKDSLVLLAAAYPAYMSLAMSWPAEDGRLNSLRTKALSRIMRDGLLAGYAHAGEYVRIADLFCTQMQRLIQYMGIVVVKHLKVCTDILKGADGADERLAAHDPDPGGKLDCTFRKTLPAFTRNDSEMSSHSAVIPMATAFNLPSRGNERLDHNLA